MSRRVDGNDATRGGPLTVAELDLTVVGEPLTVVELDLPVVEEPLTVGELDLTVSGGC